MQWTAETETEIKNNVIQHFGIINNKIPQAIHEIHDNLYMKASQIISITKTSFYKTFL